MVPMLRIVSQVYARVDRSGTGWKAALGLMAVVTLTQTVGCFELREALRGAGSADDAMPSGDAVDSNGELPSVVLHVSNPTPQLNEEVQLLCSVVSGSADEVTFSIQPAQELASLNPTTGVATIVIALSDLGTVLAFACTASNEAGTSPPSNTVVLFPTSITP